MKMNRETYPKYADARAPASKLGRNMIRAFTVGGAICVIGQALNMLFRQVCKLSEKDSGMMASVTLVFIAVLLTGIGVFDKIAKFAGAGTLVPITGFANAVVSPAIDSKSEGLVLGVGAKIFTVAGPVLLYGILSGAIYGVVYWVVLLFR